MQIRQKGDFLDQLVHLGNSRVPKRSALQQVFGNDELFEAETILAILFTTANKSSFFQCGYNAK